MNLKKIGFLSRLLLCGGVLTTFSCSTSQVAKLADRQAEVAALRADFLAGPLLPVKKVAARIQIPQKIGYVAKEVHPRGWRKSALVDINNQGTAVGQGIDANGFERSFLYRGGQIEPINPSHLKAVQIAAINNREQFVGSYRATGGKRHALLFDGAGYVDIHPAGFESSEAVAINAAGVVAGHGLAIVATPTVTSNQKSAPPQGSTLVQEPILKSTIFSYNQGQYRLLGGELWSTLSVTALGKDGTIGAVGISKSYPGREVALIFSRNSPDWEKIIQRNMPETVLTGINDQATAIGQYVDLGGRIRGFLYDHQSFLTFHTSGLLYSKANGINSHGEVVGTSYNRRSGGVKRIFLYNGTDKMYDFKLVGWQATRGLDINDNGVIVGSGQRKNGPEQGLILFMPDAEHTPTGDIYY